jgi:hypothetical protein
MAPDAEMLVDPRAVRIGLGPASRLGREEPIVVAPPDVPIVTPRDNVAGRGSPGGIGSVALSRVASEADPEAADPLIVGEAAPATQVNVIVDGTPRAARLVRRGGARAMLVIGEGSDAERHRVVFNGPGTIDGDGILRRELIVDGWRIDLELEPERRASLRARANRGHEAAAHGGPTEVRAIIPGRVVSVSVASGDVVTAGQQILVVEAMKMQNELRAPRDGTVRKVAVGSGTTVEVGDLLLVIE